MKISGDFFPLPILSDFSLWLSPPSTVQRFFFVFTFIILNDVLIWALLDFFSFRYYLSRDEDLAVPVEQPLTFPTHPHPAHHFGQTHEFTVLCLYKCHSQLSCSIHIMIIFPSRSTNSIFPEVNNGHVLSFTWFALFSSVHFPISSSSCLNLLFLIILNRYGIQFSHLLGDISPSFQSSVWFFSRPLHGCHPPTP